MQHGAIHPDTLDAASKASSMTDHNEGNGKWVYWMEINAQ